MSTSANGNRARWPIEVVAGGLGGAAGMIAGAYIGMWVTYRDSPEVLVGGSLGLPLGSVLGTYLVDRVVGEAPSFLAILSGGTVGAIGTG